MAKSGALKGKEAEVIRLRVAGWTIRRLAERYGVTNEAIFYHLRKDARREDEDEDDIYAH